MHTASIAGASGFYRRMLQERTGLCTATALSAIGTKSKVQIRTTPIKKPTTTLIAQMRTATG
jgi:hypothetical protein